MTDNETGQPRVIASYGHVIAQTLENRGIDSRSVFAEAGVPIIVGTDPMQRLRNDELSRVFEIAVRETGDPYIGLHVGESLSPGSLHAFGYAALASSSLTDFYERVCNYYRIVSENANFSHYVEDDVAVLHASAIRESACSESQDAFCALIVKLVRILYQDDIHPAWMEIRRPCPEAGDGPFVDYFKCPIKFDCEDIRLAFDSSIMISRLPGGSSELALHHDKIVMRYLGQLDRKDLVSCVKSMIVDGLASGTISKQRIAKELHMGVRSLQLKLATRNTTYQALLNSTRESLARAYIEQPNLTITEIAYLLGFADAANFTRAFKRWTGHSPSEFRARQDAED